MADIVCYRFLQRFCKVQLVSHSYSNHQVYFYSQVYAGSFFAIPLFRWFLLRKRNTDIEKRNLGRKQRARLLELPDSSLRQKVNSCILYHGRCLRSTCFNRNPHPVLAHTFGCEYDQLSYLLHSCWWLNLFAWFRFSFQVLGTWPVGQ